HRVHPRARRPPTRNRRAQPPTPALSAVGVMLPVIIVAVADDDTRGTVVDALERRYRADYDVLGVAAASALPAVLETLAGDGRVVALALAPIGEVGAACLRAVPDRFPTARRIVLVEVGDTSVAADLNRFLTLNAVDYYVGHHWATPEAELYPVPGEALRVSRRDQRPRSD